ncbi:MAG: PDZ domain-containing protein [Burkholderiales bacterium]|nr:PDZ domain-containing protein [Burkholderiales bacterium]
MRAPVRYTIVPRVPAAHLFEVTVTVSDPDPAGQRFTLPAWIPGSYMIREFARNIVTLRAESGGRPLACEKTDKATWQCAPAAIAVTLTYEVYAWDLSVRAAHLDTSHAFFNGTSVFLLPTGHENVPCEVDIARPADIRFANWKIATSLNQTPALARLSGTNATESLASAGVSQIDVKSFGIFTAENYDALIDHPVEMGTFSHASFEACGVTHHVAITGKHRADMARLCADLKKICQYQIRLFEPETTTAPMQEYWFLIMAVGDGYGGLEHRASTALICNRDDLPAAHEKSVSTGYRRFLGLASHEYFHTWNVKRIKPAAFVPYDLHQENYTRQLWFFEGITSYYDDLVLVRTGLIDPLSYLELIAENIGRVMSQSGRGKQSVAESSFDAWVKYYRQDENSPNAIVSYYQKGAMIGLALDLTIRQRTQGSKSLDDVMRALWLKHGREGIGVPEGGVEEIAAHVTGLDLKDFFARAVYGTADIDLVPLMDSVAINLAWRIPGKQKDDDPAPVTLGAKITAESNHDAKLAQVFDGGAGQAAGLSAGDVVVAVDGLRVSAMTLEKRLRSYPVGSNVALTVFRRDELMSFNVELQALSAQTCALTALDTPIDAKARRNAWLQAQ